jgi:pyruvate,orthophosphate dikinase
MVRAVDELLQVLCIKGRAKPDVLAAAVDADVAAVIEQCEREGLVENTKLGYRVTDSGRARADERYARERQEAGPVLEDVYEIFVPINDQVKQIVTDWQLREVDGSMILNDHQDPAYDASVIARLRDLDGEVETALVQLSSALPRFDGYTRRLQRALDAISAGDQTMVAAPIKDSYHTVWFELHEELLLLTGRERVE